MSSASTSTDAFPKRRKEITSRHMSLEEKATFIQVYKETLENKTATKYVVPYAAKIAGIAKSTAYKILNEYKKTGTLSESKYNGGRKTKFDIDDEELTGKIRKIIEDFHSRNEIPTLDKLLIEIRNNEDLPNMSRASLHRFITNINLRSECSELGPPSVNYKSDYVTLDDLVKKTVKKSTSNKKLKNGNKSDKLL